MPRSATRSRIGCQAGLEHEGVDGELDSHGRMVAWASRWPLREYAAKLGCQEVDESIPWRDALAEFKENGAGTTLAGYRHREGITQVQLSASTGIPQRHISEMENGRRVIGVVNAKRLAAALHCDHRRLL